MKKFVQIFLFLLLVDCVITPSIYSQDIPSNQTAGSEEARFQKEKQFKEKLKKAEEEKKEAVEKAPTEKTEAAPGKDEGQKVFVKEVRFLGNHSIPEEELRPMAAPLVNREVSLREIQDAAAEIRKYYRSKGMIAAYVYVPSQQLPDGVLKLDILEGRISDVKITGNRWFSEALLKKFTHLLKPGEVLKYDDLWKPVNRLNQRKDIQAKAVLEPGATTGTTAVNLSVEDKNPVHLAADLNNDGTRNTGKYRLGFSAENNNLLGKADELSGRLQFGQGTEALGASYMLPVNYNAGTRFGYSISYAHTSIGGDLKPLDVKGRALAHSFSLIQPLMEKEDLEIDGKVGLDIKSIENSILGNTSGKDELRIFNAGLNLDQSDPQGRMLSSHDVNLGMADFFGSSDDVDVLASRAGTGGKFFIYRGSLIRFQKLPMDLMVSFRSEWQATSYAVPPSEQIRLGGSHSVRGYQEGEYSADYGVSGSLDLYVPTYFFPEDLKLPNAKENLRKQIQLIGFADMGAGHLNKILVGEHRNKTLAGLGTGVRVHVYEDWYGRFEWGFPIGDQPFDNRRSAYYFTISKEIF